MSIAAAAPGPLIAVVGTTAAGKSDLAIEIARRFQGEIISADAFQVYRGLDIGTAKIDASAVAGVPHLCIDLVEPDDHYTAGRFAADAAAAIDSIRSRGRLPVVAGGSGFYIRALIEGLAPLPEHDRRWRQALESLASRRGLAHLFAMLEVLDPEWAAAVGAADRQRILRGLEVTLRLGVPMSAVLRRNVGSRPSREVVWIGLRWPRPLLHERIERRVDAMLEAGWLAEVEGLLASGLDPSAPGLRAIGYRQLARHLAGGLSFSDARIEIVRETRRYAKRQLTWFRGQTPTRWFEFESEDAEARNRVYGRVVAHLERELACYNRASTASDNAH